MIETTLIEKKINKGKNWYKTWGGVNVINSVKCKDGVISLE